MRLCSAGVRRTRIEWERAGGRQGQVVIRRQEWGSDFILSVVGKHVRREVTGPDVHFQWDLF